MAKKIAASRCHIALELKTLEGVVEKYLKYTKDFDITSVNNSLADRKFHADLVTDKLPQMLESLNKLRKLKEDADLEISKRGEDPLSMLESGELN